MGGGYERMIPVGIGRPPIHNLLPDTQTRQGMEGQGIESKCILYLLKASNRALQILMHTGMHAMVSIRAPGMYI